MNIDVCYQICFFCIYCLCGVFLGLVFDVFRIIRRIVHTGTFFTAIQDLIFWLIATLIFFGLSLKFNNGEIRWYMLVGISVGGFVYFKTVSKYLIIIFVRLVKCLNKFFCFILKILFVPLRFIFKLINKPVFLVLSFGRRRLYTIASGLSFRVKFFKKFIMKRSHNMRFKKKAIGRNKKMQKN